MKIIPKFFTALFTRKNIDKDIKMSRLGGLYLLSFNKLPKIYFC